MLILASKSPRRQELLKKIYSDKFDIIPSNIDENKIVSPTIFDLPLFISKAKAQYISNSHPEDYVLAADTIVICNGEVYGKPKDKQEAFNMLTNLTKGEHFVVTGYHIFRGGKDLINTSEITTLTLAPMNKNQIEEYILTGSPFDKAGGYGAQDSQIEYTIKSGTYENVLGLPIGKLKKDFISLGLI